MVDIFLHSGLELRIVKAASFYFVEIFYNQPNIHITLVRKIYGNSDSYVSNRNFLIITRKIFKISGFYQSATTLQREASLKCSRSHDSTQDSPFISPVPSKKRKVRHFTCTCSSQAQNYGGSWGSRHLLISPKRIKAPFFCS